MRLLELSMENFRCYSPKVSISFRERPGKPLITFVGTNAAGKTSAFLAIMWVLYGEAAIARYSQSRPADNQAPRSNVDLINDKVKDASPRPFMRVSLLFEHDGKKYFLFRRATAKGPRPQYPRDMTPEDVDLRIGSSGKSESFPQGIINDILPFDAFQFFFFDGEDVRRYTGATSQETRDAIEQVLGIPEIRDGRDDLDRLERKTLKQLQDQPGLDSEIRRITEFLSKASEDARNFGVTLDAKRKQLAKTSADRIGAEANREAMKEIADLNSTLNSINRETKATNESLEDALERQDELTKDIPYFLVAPKVRETLEQFKRVAGTDDLTTQLTEVSFRLQLIDELLAPDTSQCICGVMLQDFNRRTLSTLRRGFERRLADLQERAAKRTVPPVEEIQYVLGRIEGIQVDFTKHNQTISSLRAQLVDLDDKRRAIEAKIKGANVVEATKVQELIESLRESEGRLKSEIDNLARLVLEKDKTKERNAGLLSQRQHAKGVLSSLSVQQQTLSQLVSAFSWIVDQLSEKKTDVITATASKFFASVAGEEEWKGIAIDNDYSIWLLNREGKSTMPSEGFKELVALSFIFGLNKAASHKAPVVMDFLLGRLDAKHQIGVVNNLYDFTDQAIVFLLDTEINSDGVRKRLESSAAQQFLIEKNWESGNSSITELKP